MYVAVNIILSLWAGEGYGVLLPILSFEFFINYGHRKVTSLMIGKRDTVTSEDSLI